MKEQEKVTRMIGFLMMSRTYGHMAHLKTDSYAKHVALEEFYSALVDCTDSFAEVAQGKWGKLDIPYTDLKGDVNNPATGLTAHVTVLENLGKGCEDRALNNVFDDIVQLYVTTLYKLKELD